MARRLLLPFLLLVLLATPAAAAAAEKPPLRPKGNEEPLGTERLSNETTITRWAHTNLLGAVRSKPSTSSKAVGKLRWNTEDRVPEVYIVLQSKLLEGDEQAWLQIRVPGRPNGVTGWV